MDRRRARALVTLIALAYRVTWRNALELLEPLAVGAERVRTVGRAVYLYCPNGYGNTKLANTAIEKKLSCRATTRNWATTNKLLEMADVGDD